jgi:hypothetical protein
MGAAVNENVFPWIGIVLVWGTMAFGELGVLLVVAGPVSTMTVPVLATFWKGKWKLIVDATVSVLEI